MTTNKPEAFEVYRKRQGTPENVVLLADYEALHAEAAELAGALDEMIKQVVQRVSVCGNFSSDVVLRAIDALAAYRKKGERSVRLYREDQLKEIFQAAARYEWLMQEGHEWPEEVEFAIECQNKSKIDAAIDAALAAYRKQGGDT